MEPKVAKREPKGTKSQKETKREPKGAKRKPKETKRLQKRAKGSQKGAKGRPKCIGKSMLEKSCQKGATNTKKWIIFGAILGAKNLQKPL